MVFQDVFCSMMFHVHSMYIPHPSFRRRYLNDRIWTIWTNGRSGSEPLTMRKASEVDMMNKYITYMTYDITCDINRYQQRINRYQVSTASIEESNRKLNTNPTGIVWFDEFDIIWSFDDKPMLRCYALQRCGLFRVFQLLGWGCCSTPGAEYRHSCTAIISFGSDGSVFMFFSKYLVFFCLIMICF